MTKIAIASCCKIQMVPDQSGWKDIEDENPDLLLLLGDNVYMNNGKWDHKGMEKRYKQQMKDPYFASLIKKVPYLATWDDHDFGPNDTNGAEIKDWQRRKSRSLFRKYMRDSRLKSKIKVPKTMGIHYSYEIDDIKIIMLDVRYFRTGKKRKHATMLGENQEQWLWEELENNKKYTLVAGGSPIGTPGPDGTGYEGAWAGYPRFLSEFRKRVTRDHKVLVLGGDIHKNKFKSHSDFFEVVSSGIGRPQMFGKWPNQRKGKPMHNYGILEFDSTRIKVALKGKTSRDIFKTINTKSWKAK